MGWVDPRVGLGWVGQGWVGSRFLAFGWVGLGCGSDTVPQILKLGRPLVTAEVMR